MEEDTALAARGVGDSFALQTEKTAGGPTERLARQRLL